MRVYIYGISAVCMHGEGPGGGGGHLSPELVLFLSDTSHCRAHLPQAHEGLWFVARMGGCASRVLAVKSDSSTNEKQAQL